MKYGLRIWVVVATIGFVALTQGQEYVHRRVTRMHYVAPIFGLSGSGYYW